MGQDESKALFGKPREEIELFLNGKQNVLCGGREKSQQQKQ